MNTMWSIRPARVPPRAAFGQLLRTEWLTMYRQRTGLIAVGLPAVLLVIFGFIPTFRTPTKTLGGLSPLDVYLPILTALALVAIGLVILPPSSSATARRVSCGGYPPPRCRRPGCWRPS